MRNYASIRLGLRFALRRVGVRADRRRPRLPMDQALLTTSVQPGARQSPAAEEF
ncbi:MAG: hypothetical protein IJG38_01525 [Thermoguttaceae bacterium]|nr:hypothetical protein [Thermoguttaceae bacterium]MBQ6616967.1 hypothetical protein [Thermoguttaceae bacterium]